MRNHKLRNQRKNLAKLLRRGEVELRVTGSEKVGFNLAGTFNDELLIFPASFDRQKDAVVVGERVFGQKARKLLVKAAA